jgi:hypothetical protein
VQIYTDPKGGERQNIVYRHVLLVRTSLNLIMSEMACETQIQYAVKALGDLRKVTAFRCLRQYLKVHKIENFFDSDFGICVISLLFMHK